MLIYWQPIAASNLPLKHMEYSKYDVSKRNIHCEKKVVNVITLGWSTNYILGDTP